jgi:hypothetical protein
MKYILIALCLILSSCTTISYYPQGDRGNNIPYYSGAVNTPICHVCHKKAWLFKIDNKKRVICNECYFKVR